MEHIQAAGLPAMNLVTLIVVVVFVVGVIVVTIIIFVFMIVIILIHRWTLDVASLESALTTHTILSTQDTGWLLQSPP